MKNVNTKKLVLLSMFVAILIVMDITGIGFIRLPAISITIIDIPVIIGAIVLGPLSGAILGATFGCISMWEATHASSISDIVFSPFISGDPISSLIMALGARILFAFMTGLIFQILKKRKLNDYLSILISTISGLVIHNVTVIGCLCLLFPDLNVPLKKVILSIVSISFVIKIVFAFVLSSAFAKTVPKVIKI